MKIFYHDDYNQDPATHSKLPVMLPAQETKKKEGGNKLLIFWYNAIAFAFAGALPQKQQSYTDHRYDATQMFRPDFL